MNESIKQRSVSFIFQLSLKCLVGFLYYIIRRQNGFYYKTCILPTSISIDVVFATHFFSRYLRCVKNVVRLVKNSFSKIALQWTRIILYDTVYVSFSEFKLCKGVACFMYTLRTDRLESWTRDSTCVRKVCGDTYSRPNTYCRWRQFMPVLAAHIVARKHI